MLCISFDPENMFLPLIYSTINSYNENSLNSVAFDNFSESVIFCGNLGLMKINNYLNECGLDK